MAGMNTVTLLGNLVRDPVTKVLPSGDPVTNFSVAVNSQFTDKAGKAQKRVNFFDIVTYGKNAKNCAQFLNKGRQVGLQGELRQQRWQTPEGLNRSRVEVFATRVQFLGAPPNVAKPEEENAPMTEDADVPL